MKIVLLALTFLVLGAIVAESGRIVRTWRRRPTRMAPYRRSHYSSPWNYYRVPRAVHQQTVIDAVRKRNRDDAERFRGYQNERGQGTHHGYPIQRDPTTHYVPPEEDEINLGSAADTRRSTGGHVRRFRPWRRPPPPVTHISLWKLLSMQRRRRFGPPPPRRRFPQKQLLPPPRAPPAPHGSHEAEVAPILPNFVYFLPKDTMTPRENVTERPMRVTTSKDGLKPGYVANVPLYQTQATSASEFKPVTTKDYLMKVVEIRRTTSPPLVVTTKRSDEQRNAPTPETTPLDSTESLLHEVLREPPSPINSFNINIDPNAEGSEAFIKISPSSFVNAEVTATEPPPSTTKSPPTTTPTTTVRPTTAKPVRFVTTTTTAKSTTTATTATFKPMFAVRVVVPPPNLPIETAKPSVAFDELPTSVVPSSSKELKTEVVTSNSKESSPISSIEVNFEPVKLDTTNSDNFNSKEVKTTSTETKTILEDVINNNKQMLANAEIVSGKITAAPEVGQIKGAEPIVNKPTSRPAPAYKWPTMKPYIKSVKKPIISTSSKVSSTVVKSSGTSSESTSVSVTGIRSKVKEYKTVLKTAPGLLLFDKVDTSAEIEKKGSMTSTTSSPQTTKKNEEDSITSTTISPMQNFDPMKMIHSWLTKAKPKS